MKKSIAFLFALTLALVFAMSCNNSELEEKESVAIEGLPESVEFPAVPTGDVTFTVTSNVNWSISQQDLDWVSITPSRGLGNGESVVVTISPSVNKDFEPRSGKLTVTAGSVTASSSLTQLAAVAEPVFNVSGFEGETLYVDALDVEGKSFNVSSNKEWTAEVNGMAWANVSPLQGDKDRSATITVVPKTANDEEVREGTISFSYGAAAPKVVKVVHKKFEPELALSVAEMTASSTGKIADPVVKVTSNGAWTATCSQTWVSVDKAEGAAGETEVTVSLEANMEGKDRSAVVAFKNKGLTVELTVNQGSEFVETSIVTISTAENVATFEVRANVAWSVASSEAWATVSPAEGTGNGTVTVTMDPLVPGSGSRKANITVAAKEVEGLSAVVEFEQLAPVMTEYIDLLQTPVLFCSNNYAWNVTHSPDYATSGENGSDNKKPDTETLFGSGKGTGVLCSYSHPDNADVYMKFVSETATFLMAAEGNITAKNVWTDDAFTFNIPVTRLDVGYTLHFDYGVYATNKMARYWISEVSLDGGNTWEPFATGQTYETPGLKALANTDLGTASKKEKLYNGTYTVSSSVVNAEIIVRLRCADGTHYMNGTNASKPNSGAAVRIIGADQDVESDVNAATVKGPKIYVSVGENVIIPELTVSQNAISVTETTASFTVTSNVDWTVTSSASWATVSPAEGTGEGTVNVTLTPLDPGSPDRTATITVSAKDHPGVSEAVIIEQIAPQGNFINLAETSVLFCSNNYSWNVTHSPDYATSGENGSDNKKPDSETMFGSGKGTGMLCSYSHSNNPEVYMKFVSETAKFIMAAEGNITAKNTWTDDAFTFYIPVTRIDVGQTLHFDYGVYATNKTARYWNSEVSLDGGSTWESFNTGQTYETPGLKVSANTDLGTASKKEKFYNATYTVSTAVSYAGIIVRLRCADGTHYMNGTNATKPNSSATVRIIGADQNVASDANAATIKGPKIYIN